MPEEKKTYIVDNTPVDVDNKDVDGFLSANPNAKEAKSFVVGNDTVDVLIDDLDGFMKSVPDAKPLFEEASAPDESIVQTMQGYGAPKMGKPSAVPSASVGGGSATKERGVEQPSTLPTKSSEASLDNIQKTMQVYADGQGAFPETLSAADVKELRKQVPGGELPNVSDEKVAKMLAGKSPKQVRIESVNAIPDIKERKTEQARMYLDFSREKSAENQQLDQNITALNEGLQQIKAEGENLQQQLQNPNIDPQTASMLSESLQQTQANYSQAVNDYNDQLNKYQQNARFIKTMGAGGLSSLKGMLPSSMWQPRNPLDVGVAAAWNSTAPPLLKTLGAVIESYPAIAFGEDTENTHSPVADAIFKLADMAEVNVGKYSPEANVSLMDDVNVYNTSQLLGNLLGSVAMTFGGGGAAGTIGAQAAGFSQVYGDVYKQGRDAGLTQAEAMYFAMPTGIVAAYLGDKGVESLAGVFGKTSLKSAIKQGVKDLAEKRTPQMMMEFGQKVLTNTLEGAAKEGLQEGSEFVTEFGSKKGASLKEGVKFKDDLSLKGFGKGLAESAITGAVGGGLLGPFFGAGKNSAFSNVVNKAARDPKIEASFMEQVDASVAANDITQEQKQQIVEMLEKTKQAAATVPPVVESEPARAEATALVLEQQDLEQQIEQTNPAMAKPLNDRLDEVNNRLGEIAEGKNLPTEEEVTTERKVKTLEEEINIGDTVDLTPLVESSKAKVEVQADNISKEDNDKWTSIIDQSTSPRELDKIIDSIDADGQMTPELITAINTKRESLSPQQTPAAEAPQTLPEVEQARADIEARRKEELRRMTYDEFLEELPNNSLALISNKELLSDATFRVVGSTSKEQSDNGKPQIDISYQKPDGTYSVFSTNVSEKTAERFKDANWNEEEINAKYDAELDALNKPTTEAQAPVAEEAKGESVVEGDVESRTNKLESKLSDFENNTRSQSTKDLIAWAEDIFDTKFEGDFNKGEYISFFNSLGDKGYEAARYLQNPKKALSILKESPVYLAKLAGQSIPTQEAQAPTSEQAPESFPAQEGAASEQEKEFKAHPELEQVYRDLHAAVTKNLDPNTLEAVKRNPTLVMVEKALRELERKGVIKIEC